MVQQHILNLVHLITYLVGIDSYTADSKYSRSILTIIGEVKDYFLVDIHYIDKEISIKK